MVSETTSIETVRLPSPAPNTARVCKVYISCRVEIERDMPLQCLWDQIKDIIDAPRSYWEHITDVGERGDCPFT